MNKIAIISDAVPLICDKFRELGFKLIYTEKVDGFISYEQKHADMQCCVVNNKIFMLSSCKKLVKTLENSGFDITHTKNRFSGKYPQNILLNAKIIGKYIIGKIEYLDSELIKFCKAENYIPINVNQGYSACSILKVTDNAVITADCSIHKTLQNTGVDVLKINEGSIELFGAGKNTYGFIGGASTNIDDNTILFFGNIINHPDFHNIKSFCSKYNINIDYIPDIPLTDIGSAILLNN